MSNKLNCLILKILYKMTSIDGKLDPKEAININSL